MQPVAAASQHLCIDVGEHDESGCAYLLQHSEAEIAGATSHIERALTRAQARAPEREAFPQAMRARGHQVVHQVVAVRDGIEHAANTARLLAPGHLLEAEIRL